MTGRSCFFPESGRPSGTFGGSLKDFTATDLGTFSATAALDAAGIDPAQVGHVFYGNALQTAADAIYLRVTSGCVPGFRWNPAR